MSIRDLKASIQFEITGSEVIWLLQKKPILTKYWEVSLSHTIVEKKEATLEYVNRFTKTMKAEEVTSELFEDLICFSTLVNVLGWSMNSIILLGKKPEEIIPDLITEEVIEEIVEETKSNLVKQITDSLPVRTPMAITEEFYVVYS